MISDAFPILTTADVERSLAFYRDLLGYEVTYRFPPQGPPDYVAIVSGESRLGIGVDPATAGRDRDSGVFSLCAYVADVDATVARLREAEATILSEPVDRPWGERMAEVADPDGVRIVLMAPLG